MECHMTTSPNRLSTAMSNQTPPLKRLPTPIQVRIHNYFPRSKIATSLAHVAQQHTTNPTIIIEIMVENLKVKYLKKSIS